MQRLLATAFAAKAQPAECDAGIAFLCKRQLYHPAYGVVVEQGDDLGYLGRRRAMGEHAINQLDYIAPQAGERFDAWRVANGPRQVHQVDPLQGKQVPLRHHAAQASVPNQAHVGDMTTGHGDGCVERTGVGAQVER